MDKNKIKEGLKDGIDIVAQPILDFSSSFIFNSVVASAIPSVGAIVLGYKQKRAEKMLNEFILQMKNNLDEINYALRELKKDRFNQIKERQYAMILDYVIENNQEEKIIYMANGFINLTKYDNFDDDMLLMYYNTLEVLSVLDLKIFEEYYKYINDIEYTFDKILDIFAINNEYLDLITQKLIREGLIVKKVSNELVELAESVRFKSIYQDFEQKQENEMYRIAENILHNRHEYELSKYGEEFRKFFNRNLNLSNEL